MEMQREKLAEEISLVRQKMKAVTSSDLNAEESSEKHRHMRLLEYVNVNAYNLRNNCEGL